MSRKVVVGAAASVPPGTRHRFVVDGRPVVVLNIDGLFYALGDTCPHRGARLSDGDTVCGALRSTSPGDYDYEPARRVLKCPWHGWEFDIESGRSWADPARTRLRPYVVDVETGARIAASESQSFVAETFPVSVEDDYLVLTLDIAGPAR